MFVYVFICYNSVKRDGVFVESDNKPSLLDYNKIRWFRMATSPILLSRNRGIDKDSCIVCQKRGADSTTDFWQIAPPFHIRHYEFNNSAFAVLYFTILYSKMVKQDLYNINIRVKAIFRELCTLFWPRHCLIFIFACWISANLVRHFGSTILNYLIHSKIHSTKSYSVTREFSRTLSAILGPPFWII